MPSSASPPPSAQDPGDPGRDPDPDPGPGPDLELDLEPDLDPRRLRPMLATAGTARDLVGEHAYEFKWDGVRVLAFVAGDGTLVLRSRSGSDVTGRYPELGPLASAIGRPVVLDGEVVVLDADGAPSFAALQSRMHLDPDRAARAARTRPVVLLLFDLLALDGSSRMHEPYEARRGALRSLGLGDARWQVPPVGTDLATVLAIADDRGLEGVVAKRLGSPYRPGARSSDWVKLKLTVRQEVVVGGWRPGRGGAGGRIGAVLVGVHDDRGRLRYAGGVGSGLSEAAATELAARLRSRDTSPFVDDVPHGDARFVAPQVVVEVRASGWTPAGRLRHPVFLGIRADADATTVRRDAHVDDLA